MHVFECLLNLQIISIVILFDTAPYGQAVMVVVSPSLLYPMKAFVSISFSYYTKYIRVDTNDSLLSYR